MVTYKIRISQTGREEIHEVRVASDFVAIRYGQRLAKHRDTVEVFRRGECIFKSEELVARMCA
jgi:hypothetical protein